MGDDGPLLKVNKSPIDVCNDCTAHLTISYGQLVNSKGSPTLMLTFLDMQFVSRFEDSSVSPAEEWTAKRFHHTIVVSVHNYVREHQQHLEIQVLPLMCACSVQVHYFRNLTLLCMVLSRHPPALTIFDPQTALLNDATATKPLYHNKLDIHFDWGHRRKTLRQERKPETTSGIRERQNNRPCVTDITHWKVSLHK